MPNMFGSGPLEKTLKLLANEVWEEPCMLLASYGGRAERGWRRSCGVMKGPLCQSGLRPFSPIPSQPLGQEGACCLKFMGHS